MADLFGELQWNSKPMSNPKVPLSVIMPSNGHSSISTNGELQDDSISATVIRKKKQWSIDASSVPHFLCILSKKNYLLFACDKYGCIDLYQLDDNDPSNVPRHLRQFNLFPGNNANRKPCIIEAFTVYTPFIVVSARMFKRKTNTNYMPQFNKLLFIFAVDLGDQTDTSSVYFFDHRGIQQGDTCLQKFPVRQLSADTDCKYLWGVDRHQHSGIIISHRMHI